MFLSFSSNICFIFSAVLTGKVDFSITILSNPEFLAEGTAIQDLFKSDRVLIGGENTKSGKKAIEALVKIYSNWIPTEKILNFIESKNINSTINPLNFESAYNFSKKVFS